MMVSLGSGAMGSSGSVQAPVRAQVQSPVDFDGWVRQQLLSVEAALSQWVPQGAPAGLGEAMRYGVLDGGKRLRPLLVLAACEAVRGDPAHALRAAAAVELIHAYSLIHDDMPCMDNDVLRRGKPTVHVKFGQAQAMLAGDAMQALAFEVLTADEHIPTSLQSHWCRLLARASGHDGMAGGQAIDLASVGVALDESSLAAMHGKKTGALLKASVLMGAACQAVDARAWESLGRFGDALGLAFQVVDDVLDVTQASDVLGKTAGKDQHHNKPTYVSVMGVEKAMDYARTLGRRAQQALEQSGLEATRCLSMLAERVVERDN